MVTTIYGPSNLVEDNVLRTPSFLIELKTKKQKLYEPGKIIFSDKSQYKAEKNRFT